MERISFGLYRHPATPAAAEIPLTAIAEKEKQRRISRAAQLLEPYFVDARRLDCSFAARNLISPKASKRSRIESPKPGLSWPHMMSVLMT